MTKRLPPLAMAILLFPSAALCGPKIKTRVVAPDQVTKFTKNKPVEVVLLDGDLRHGSVSAADGFSLDLLSASGVAAHEEYPGDTPTSQDSLPDDHSGPAGQHHQHFNGGWRSGRHE
jgi:hypothetical protein